MKRSAMANSKRHVIALLCTTAALLVFCLDIYSACTRWLAQSGLQQWQARWQQQQALQQSSQRESQLQQFLSQHAWNEHTQLWLTAERLRQMQAWQHRAQLPVLHYRQLVDTEISETLKSAQDLQEAGLKVQYWQIDISSMHEDDSLRWLHWLQAQTFGSLRLRACQWSVAEDNVISTRCILEWWHVPTNT